MWAFTLDSHKMLGELCQMLATAPLESQKLGVASELSPSAIPIIRRPSSVLFHCGLASQDAGSVGF